MNINCLSKMALIFILCLVFNVQSFAQVQEKWVHRHDGPANSWDNAADLVVDADGNTYVTGFVSIASPPIVTSFVTIKISPNGVTEWVRTYHGEDGRRDRAMGIVIDINNNVYVTGISWDGDYYSSIATVKYDTDGNQLWVRRFPTPGPSTTFYSPAKKKPIGIDAAANIYIAGFYTTGASDMNIVTINYDSQGNLLWSNTYDGLGYYIWVTQPFPHWEWQPSNDAAVAIHVDNVGNVVVAGQTQPFGYYDTTPGPDFIILKYTTDGAQAWVQTFGLASVHDYPWDVIVDVDGNIVVTGSSTSYPTENITTVKYNHLGAQMWDRQYGVGSESASGNAVTVDNLKNIYITGYINTNIVTLKYNQAGALQWDILHPGRGGEDIALDQYSNVYVTGSIDSGGDSDWDYITIRYNNLGNLFWSITYNGTASQMDYAVGIAIDPNNNVIVTGNSAGVGTLDDITTIKYAHRTISGIKFRDLNCNGVFEAGEPGLAGWRIELAGPVNDFRLTGAGGEYSFENLPEGNYVVSEVLQPGWMQTMPAPPGFYNINITPQNPFFVNIDFGNCQGRISGIKFNDLNANGQHDAGEPGLPGWQINLAGPVVGNMLTGAGGVYEFDNLPPGNYQVSEVLQPEWIVTTPAVFFIVITPPVPPAGNAIKVGINFGNHFHFPHGSVVLAMN
ncbi:MAG: SdrD B-like domain-containing protein [Bacteroidota bacterium]|nr:SdrD B-like domain-containing protein [Bacteroidota bacterium]